MSFLPSFRFPLAQQRKNEANFVFFGAITPRSLKGQGNSKIFHGEEKLGWPKTMNVANLSLREKCRQAPGNN
jgi:hypothetical protein